MVDRKALKRALERLGFRFLRGGWVRREVAPKLQAQIDKAVQDAAQDVERVKAESGKVPRNPDSAGHGGL